MVDTVRTYQDGVDGHWAIQAAHSAGDEVVVRWVGSGTHVGEVNGVPPTGRPIRVDAISIDTVRDGRITWTREVWDTLGFLQQIGVCPRRLTSANPPDRSASTVSDGLGPRPPRRIVRKGSGPPSFRSPSEVA